MAGGLGGRARLRGARTLRPEPPRNPRKRYVLEMLPYPSGSLHMGHMLVYTIGDVRAHFSRRNGWEVLRPMGFDSFGLPAENAAINDGGHPREIVERNIAAIRRTMKSIGWAIDWSRELSTHEPEYYRWTQWLFLQFLEAGLADRRAAPVKWCPNDQTVLANEQVKDGRCDRCGALVESRNIEQWFFKTTLYADQLLDFSSLDWPDRVIAAQRHWIGRSEGAEVLFGIEGRDEGITVFTTRPDTLFGATFFVLAPEHPLVEEFARGGDNGAEIREYVRRAATKRGEERAAAEEKTGVFTGAYAVNPVNGERLPIWIADYVLMEYGTGAIMAVPAHDERDLEFAEKFGLDVRVVVDRRRRTRSSTRAGSRGMPAADGKRGDHRVAHRAGDGRARRQLPAPRLGLLAPALLGLPDPDHPLRRLRPRAGARRRAAGAAARSRGLPPEGRAAARLERGVDARRVPELRRAGRGARPRRWTRSSTRPGTSCATATRTTSEAAFDRDIIDYWGPVDFYQGGVDHATMHMIYARFFQKALADIGLAGFREPFARFHGNGWVQLGGTKMSKSKGNVARPGRVRRRVRGRPGPALHPLHRPRRAGHGVHRLRPGGDAALRAAALADRERGCRSCRPRRATPAPLTRKAHQTIARVTDDIGRRESFNTRDLCRHGARQRPLPRPRRSRTRGSPPRRPSR